MNMLRRLQVTNFKSLMETEIRLEKNTFLIGLNGSGKTSILQSIDFLSAIAKGKVDEWLKIRGWEKSELTFSGNNKKLIEFQISFKLRDNEYRWDFTFNRDLLRNTSEKYTKCSQDEIQVLLEVKEGHYALLGSSKNKIAFNYEGSIISVLKDEALGEELKEIRNFFSNIKVVWESQNEALTYILSLEGVLYMICPAQSYIIFRDRGSEWTIVG